MGTRSVRLDAEAEAALNDILQKTGASISDAIKQGLLEYREKALLAQDKRPAEFFNNFDLGDGEYALIPARQAKSALKNKLKQKHSNR
ncbi:MAG: hypothetical protein GY820_42015 [Gammaproteobacteria bacterium]|nr:hypothetical protein [Gammaproteobacteria bacterium]